eukprot:symbB.v1.2.015029.t1/scaffold1037.1/size142759/1
MTWPEAVASMFLIPLPFEAVAGSAYCSCGHRQAQDGTMVSKIFSGAIGGAALLVAGLQPKNIAADDGDGELFTLLTRIFELGILMVALGLILVTIVLLVTPRADDVEVVESTMESTQSTVHSRGRWNRARLQKSNEVNESEGQSWRRARGENHNALESSHQIDLPIEESQVLKISGASCTVRLRNGMLMPQMGLGSGDLEGREGREAICTALRAGYRLIDTALFYRTEKEIAAGVRMAGLKRDQVFICTKVLQKAHASEAQVRNSLKESLKNLDTNYVDLYVIHNPRAGRIKEVWSLLLKLREEGLCKAVGVSNFGVGQLEGLRESGFELPEVNQIEVHCWRQLPEVTAYHAKHGIATMCMAPLARGRMFGRSDLAKMAEEMGRTEAEVAIRWSLQKGLPLIDLPHYFLLQSVL